MRLLLDEMLAGIIALELRRRGHDVVAVNGDPEREGLPDEAVMALARDDRRALVTNNLIDFRPLHHEAVTPGGPGHFGMIFVPGGSRRTRADVGRIVVALEQVLAAYPGEADLVDGEAWL